MADIVDSFVVSLGLDPSKYNDEIKKYRQDRKRLNEEDAKNNRDQEDAQRRLTAGVKQLRNETAGFVLMLAGATGIKQFASDILTSDAATGRFAANMGLATEKVGAWEEAAKRAGGTAQSIQGALAAMASAYQNKTLRGDNSKDADFIGLGISAIPSDPSETLLQIASASQRMDRRQFQYRAAALGLDPSTITLLAKGREGLQALLVQMEKQGVANQKAADDAIAFDNALNDIEQSIKGKARPAIDQLARGLADLTNNGENLNKVTDVAVGLLGAAGVAAVVAYGPFFALAGVIALLAANFNQSDWAMKNWSRTASGLSDLLNGNIGSGLGKLWDELKEEAGSAIDDAMDYAQAPDRNGRAARQAGRRQAARGAPARSSGGATRISTTNSVLRNGAGGTDPEIYRALAAKYGPERARGITAGIAAEGGSLGMAANGAFGIGQWRGARQRALFAKYGRNPTKAQQIEFLMSELDGGDPGGASVLGQSSAYGAAERYIGAFMRPGPGYAGDMRRVRAALNMGGRYGSGAGGMAGGGGSSTTNVGTINIYTKATDAGGIARDMRGELAKRGLVVQAGSGLQP